MKNGLFLLFCLLAASNSAFAGILFEPYVGYESGTFASKDFAPGGEVKYTNTSVDGGLRLGYRSGGFWIAADALYASGGKMKQVNPGTNYNFTGVTIFGSMGYDFSTRIRLMVSGGTQDNFYFKNENGTGGEVAYSGGVPVKAGLGYYLLPHVCINAEYVMHDYKTYRTSTMKGPISDLDAETIRSSSVLVTLSFPMTL